jgi:hypothetical protein
VARTGKTTASGGERPHRQATTSKKKKFSKVVRPLCRKQHPKDYSGAGYRASCEQCLRNTGKKANFGAVKICLLLQNEHLNIKI